MVTPTILNPVHRQQGVLKARTGHLQIWGQMVILATVYREIGVGVVILEPGVLMMSLWQHSR